MTRKDYNALRKYKSLARRRAVLWKRQQRAKTQTDRDGLAAQHTMLWYQSERILNAARSRGRRYLTPLCQLCGGDDCTGSA